MKLNWNFQRGGRVSEKIPSVEEVWIFSAITHLELTCILTKLDTFLVFCDYDISSVFDPVFLSNLEFSNLGNGGQFEHKVLVIFIRLLLGT